MDELVRQADQQQVTGRVVDEAKRMIDREGLVGSVLVREWVEYVHVLSTGLCAVLTVVGM